MNIFWILMAAFFTTPLTLVAEHNLLWAQDLTITPAQLFTGEDRTATAQVQLTHPSAQQCRSCLSSEEMMLLKRYWDNIPPQIDLVQYADDGSTVKYRWKLNDTGHHGDLVAGDHIYTSEFQLKKRKPKTLHFSVEHPELRIHTIGTRTAPSTSVLIVRRPTFIELLKNLWKHHMERP